MKTVLNVKTDKKVKEDAQLLAKHIGIPLSTVVNAYLKEFIASGEVRLSREPQLRPEVARRLEKHINDAKPSENISGPFSSVEEMMQRLCA